MSEAGMMHNLNFNYLKIFEAVYRLESMTEASNELHLTQSGVSQHIKALEEQVGHKLFDRLHRKILPTEEAHELHRGLKPAIQSIYHTLESVSGAKRILRGIVRVGMPIEFGLNVISPLLAKIGEKHPKIKFEVYLDYANKFNDMLLENKLDFAFVDSFQLNKRIIQEKVAEESLLLCASKEYLDSRPPIKWSKPYFEDLDYIAYQKGEPVIRQWLSHHLKRKNFEVNVKSWVMDIQIVAKFIQAGLGVGILPDHLVERLQKQKANIVTIETKKSPTKNTISLAYLRGRDMSEASKLVVSELKEALSY